MAMRMALESLVWNSPLTVEYDGRKYSITTDVYGDRIYVDKCDSYFYRSEIEQIVNMFYNVKRITKYDEELDDDVVLFE